MRGKCKATLVGVMLGILILGGCSQVETSSEGAASTTPISVDQVSTDEVSKKSESEEGTSMEKASTESGSMHATSKDNESTNSVGVGAISSSKEDTISSQGIMRDLSTMEIVEEMGVGINLGNTFEACGDWIKGSTVATYERAWGSPIIKKETIEGYAAAGFGVLRVPVAWSNMMGEDYTIHPDYLARVQEVVNWGLDSGMYVIVNIHWDSGWWEAFPTDKEECMYKYKRIWTQLTEAFKEYGDYLMLESLNEEGCWDTVWNRYSGRSNGKAEAYGLLNEINQTFVDIVRASGGNNEKRHLLIAGYATDIALTCDPLFKMPKDAQNRQAVSVHYYTPSTFAILEEDAEWGKARSEWGSEADYNELYHNMDLMKATFIDQGIPVIVGEFGVATKNKTPEMVRQYLTAVCEAAYTRKLCPVLWDITGVFYDRSLNKMKDEILLEDLMAVGE